MSPEDMRDEAGALDVAASQVHGSDREYRKRLAHEWRMVAELCERLEWLKPLVFVDPDQVDMDDLVNTGPGRIIRYRSGVGGARFIQDDHGCVWDGDTGHWLVRSPSCPHDHRHDPVHPPEAEDGA